MGRSGRRQSSGVLLPPPPPTPVTPPPPSPTAATSDQLQRHTAPGLSHSSLLSRTETNTRTPPRRSSCTMTNSVGTSGDHRTRARTGPSSTASRMENRIWSSNTRSRRASSVPTRLFLQNPSPPSHLFLTRAGLYPHLGHDPLPHDEPRRDVASVRDGVAARPHQQHALVQRAQTRMDPLRRPEVRNRRGLAGQSLPRRGAPPASLSCPQ